MKLCHFLKIKFYTFLIGMTTICVKYNFLTKLLGTRIRSCFVLLWWKIIFYTFYILTTVYVKRNSWILQDKYVSTTVSIDFPKSPEGEEYENDKRFEARDRWLTIWIEIFDERKLCYFAKVKFYTFYLILISNCMCKNKFFTKIRAYPNKK